MTVSYWQDRSAEQLLTCDTCVVGAGIVGAYTAKCLAQAGEDTLIIEARHVAAGATGRNAGMVLTGLAAYYHEAVAEYGPQTAREVWQLTLENRALLFTLAEEYGVPYERDGSLVLALDAAEADELEKTARALAVAGLPGEYMRGDPTGRGFTASLAQAGDGATHPALLAEALVRASGARLLENSEVFDIRPTDAGVEVRSRLATIRCRRVALCTNAYAPLLNPFFAGLVIPTRAQVFVTAPIAERIWDPPGYADYGYEYFRQLPDGAFLLGGWRQHFRAEEVGYEDRVTPGVQAGLEAFRHRYFPELDGVPITHRWSGVMGFSRDHIPLVGTLPDMPTVGFSVGFTGHGLGWGLKTAERLVALLLHGTSPGILDVKRSA
ncbi:MAG: NAD(P)/FAD-dependent oxidoreductase [Chloroflexia bacterium]